MNKSNRKELEKAKALIEEANDIIQNVKDDEEEKHGNMPEGLQNGEKGEKMQEGIDALDNCLSSIEEIIENIDLAIE